MGRMIGVVLSSYRAMGEQKITYVRYLRFIFIRSDFMALIHGFFPDTAEAVFL